MAAAAMCVAAVALPSLPAQACAMGHISLRLADFPPESGDGFLRPFYYAEEGGTATFTVRRTSDECGETLARTRYVVDPDTATQGTDYQPTSDLTMWLDDPGHGSGPYEDAVQVPTIEDQELESATERALIRLHSPENAVLNDPFEAPLYIIDDEGPTRYSFGEASYDQSETYTSVRIPIFRAGDASGPSSIGVTFGPGDTNPALAGSDYTVPSTVVSFSAGDRVDVIEFNLINDSKYEPTEELRLTLGAGATDITQTTLRIIDNEESIPPRSRIHHPKHGYTYEQTDFRLRELHVFTSDEGGSGVLKARLALRRKMADGSCGWWSGDGFTAGDCAAKRWLRMRKYEPDFFYYRLPQLKRSVGTNVRSYRAFSQAIDGAGNRETKFVVGRNDNTFDVN